MLRIALLFGLAALGLCADPGADGRPLHTNANYRRRRFLILSPPDRSGNARLVDMIGRSVLQATPRSVCIMRKRPAQRSLLTSLRSFQIAAIA